MIPAFTWRDGERTIRFGRGALCEATSVLGDGYLLLTTDRAAAAAPDVAAGAAQRHTVAQGPVDQLAEDLLGHVPDDDRLLVALGGGRVVDTAKAIAAVHGGRRVAAVPTTLSAAEMTRIHRLPPSAPPGTQLVRPGIVINDPALCASQPEPELAASAANSLAHAVEGQLTVDASPVPTLAGQEAARLTLAAYTGDATPDRDALALAALLSGYAIDAAGYGLHHVLAQTLVRHGGVGHGPANAALLPHTLGALRRRAGDRVDAGLEPLARDLAVRAGATSLRELGVDDEALERCADAAAARGGHLARTPPAADRDEILALYRAAA